MRLVFVSVCSLFLAPIAEARLFDQMEFRPVFASGLTNFDFSEDQELAWGSRQGLDITFFPHLGFSLGYQDFGSAYADYRTRFAITPVLVTPPVLGNDDKERLQARGTYLGAFADLPFTHKLKGRLEVGGIRLSRERRSDLGLFYFHEFSFVAQTFEDWRPYGRLTFLWAGMPGIDVFAGVGFTGGNGRIRFKQYPVYETELGQPHLRLTTYEVGVSIQPNTGVLGRLKWSFAVGPSMSRVSWLEGADWTAGYSIETAVALGKHVDLFLVRTNSSSATAQYYGRLIDFDPVQAEWDGQAIDADTTDIGLRMRWSVTDRFSVSPSFALVRVDGWVALVPLRDVILGPLRFFVYLRQWQFTPGIALDYLVGSNVSLSLAARTHELDIPNPFPFEPARSAADPSARMTSLTLWLRWRF